jgi:hypothetical protein
VRRTFQQNASWAIHLPTHARNSFPNKVPTILALYVGSSTNKMQQP